MCSAVEENVQGGSKADRNGWQRGAGALKLSSSGEP